MSGPLHVAVIDIGKTNVKLALVDMDDLREIAVVTRPNIVLAGPPWPHFDVEGHWDFLMEALGQFHRAHRVDAISITTHGASAALLDSDGELAAPVLDYEYHGPDDLALQYDAVRPDFAETGSPRLPGGLNLGAQLFWQFSVVPALHERTAAIVTYPQYWGFRLTGVAASDVTSLGCHTDLWNPYLGEFSSLVERLGLKGMIAPARVAGEVLGPVLAQIAALTGLAVGTPVYCGIHDSNASLLPHLRARVAPFSVVSTGTWVVVMTIGGKPVILDPAKDVLVNVNALGDPVPSARFMGGREFETVIAAQYTTPSAQDVAEVLNSHIMLLPAVMADSGPFQGQQAHWAEPEPAIGSGVRAAALSFYLALVTSECLRLIGHQGVLVVEGPFARNVEYCAMLAMAVQSPVMRMKGATGTSQGAAMLADPDVKSGAVAYDTLLPVADEAMLNYVRVWNESARKKWSIVPGRR